MSLKIWNLPVTHLMRFSEVNERRPVLLVTSSPAWQAVKDHLRGLAISARVEVRQATLAHWESLLAGLTVPAEFEVVYAVGGGLAADAAKFLAHKLNLPLVVLPTALSVDAFLTWASGIRRDGCVHYIETTAPGQLILDLEAIARAPVSVRAAGITDVLSIATGSWDWLFAHEQRRNPPGMAFVPWVYANAQSIYQGALDCAEAAGRGDPEGLKQLYDCLAMEVQLCNQVGHSRPEEGSEHYFAYCVESYLDHSYPHGDLVGPGILHMARLQGQDTHSLQAALTACHIQANAISIEMTERVFRQLPAYCQEHALPYGIAHTLS